MASRAWKHNTFSQGEYVRLPFTLLPAGAGTPVMGEGDPKQVIMTPARTGVGVYTLTLIDKFPALVSCKAQASLGTAALSGCNATVVVTGSVVVVTLKTFNAAGAALELNSGSGDAIYGELILRNSSNTP